MRARRTFNKDHEHYIDNAKFYDAMTKYKILCIEADEAWDREYSEDYNQLLSEGIKQRKAKKILPQPNYPKITDYVGSCLYLISIRLATSANFAGYTYRDDMIGDGLENCLSVIRSFDHNQESKNPFSYFTQIAYHAFVRRIKKEKKHQELKKTMILNSSIVPELQASTIPGDNTQYELGYINYMMDHIDHGTAEDARSKKRQAKMPKRLTKYHQAKFKEEKELEEAHALIELKREEDAIKDVGVTKESNLSLDSDWPVVHSFGLLGEECDE